MFRIIDDTIEYDYRPVAVFLPNLGATFRDRAAEDIEAAKPNMISEQDHADALRGQEEGFEADIARLEIERDRAREEADRWLRELNSLDEDTEDGAPGRIVDLVKEKEVLAQTLDQTRRRLGEALETIRQLQYEAKHQKSSKNRPLDRRRAPVAD